MAEVTLDGKRYVVEERAASLIERIRELSGSGGFADGGMSGESDSVQGPDESEMEALVQIYREYLELSEEQQAYVLNYDVMEEMTEQAGERNHLDQNTKIRAEGVEWYIRLEVSPVAETDVFYRELQSSIGSGTLRTLYRIGFTDLLTGEEYQPEREVALTIPADSVLRKAGAEPEAPDHEMEGESSQGQNEGTDGAGLNGGSAAGDVGSSQGQNEGTDGAGLNGGSAAGDAGSSSGPAGGDMEGEQFLVILVGEDGSIWYPDFVSEDGAFLLKAKDFTHFGIAAALAESSLVLEDETESETENETETDAVTEAERVPETESESETETAVAAAGFGGPMVILWIVMLVVGTNILVLSFLGKKGYLNFPGEE